MFVTPSSFLPVSLRRVGGVALACSALVLSACGGGDRAAEYQPASIVSFGDEGSAFTSVAVPAGGAGEGGTIRGLTYAVNSLVNGSTTFCEDQNPGTLCVTPLTDVSNFTAAGTPTYGYFTSVNTDAVFNVVTRIDLGTGDYATLTGDDLKRTTDQFYNCSAITLWTQVVARAFGKGYESDCPVALAGAVSHAVAGAKVADLAAQIAAAKLAGELKSGVLVTVWVGQNDLVEIYESDVLVTSAAKITEAEKRAVTLINRVKEILDTGAKVLLVNSPNLGYSPYALDVKKTGCSDTTRDCNGDMEALIVKFNAKVELRIGDLGLPNEGRRLARVNAAELTNTYARSTSYENKRQCDAAKMARPDGTPDSSSLAYCHTGTLANGGNVGNYLWADDVRVSWTLHSLIASTAVTRAAEQF